MPIYPLPQFEADMEADRRDRETYERLKPPSSIVVRFGVMKLVGEFPYTGDAKPGCGSKIVVRTHRGVELGEMLTSTCPNSGCSKSVSRQEMLEYIENSGGHDYPFFTEGKALRVASAQDLAEQSRLDGMKSSMIRFAREQVAHFNLPMKIVDAEPLLGGDRITFYFTSEERIDFRELVQELSRTYGARIDLRQVGARDEARLVADYERCGQHCCCKQFLKVLKPISIKAAKTQKATLDPLKISGRCGRLMCCLRYEDETYNDLVKRLPKIRKSVGTPFGVGVVIDRQILTQLVLVRLDHDGKDVAVPVEELMAPEDAPPPGSTPGANGGSGGSGGAGGADPMRGASPSQVEQVTREPSPRGSSPSPRQERHRQRGEREQGRPPSPAPERGGRRQEPAPSADAGESSGNTIDTPPQDGESDVDRERRRRRRRRRKGKGARPDGESAQGAAPSDGARPRPYQPSDEPVRREDASPPGTPGTPEGGGTEAQRRRKRRRRRPGSGGQSAGGGSPFSTPGG